MEGTDGGEITLMVRADGLPKPEIRWFLNGNPISEDQNHKIVTNTDAQVTSTLTVTGFTLDDVGQVILIYPVLIVDLIRSNKNTLNSLHK